MYDPPGPPNEAFASYYVRHLVQRAIDHAFKLSRPPEPATTNPAGAPQRG